MVRRPGEGAMLAAQSSPVSGFVFAVAALATSIVLVAALAWASRQLLGLPVGTSFHCRRRACKRRAAMMKTAWTSPSHRHRQCTWFATAPAAMEAVTPR
jgi:hypothetical protein